MEKWAKLFESNGRQVMITKETDNQHYRLCMKVRIEGSEILSEAVFMGGNAKGRLDWLFERSNQETADNFTRDLIDCNTIEDAISGLPASTNE